MFNKKIYDKIRYKKRKAKQAKQTAPDPICFLKRTERSYIAGIIDGEGTIYARNERKSIYPTLAVHMTDKAVIMWLQKHIKAQTVWTINRRKGDQYKSLPKPQYLFRICGKRAKLLCKSIFPYLITKREHAKLVLIWPTDVRGKGLTKDIQAIRKILGNRLTALNGYRYQNRHN